MGASKLKMGSGARAPPPKRKRAVESRKQQIDEFNEELKNGAHTGSEDDDDNENDEEDEVDGDDEEDSGESDDDPDAVPTAPGTSRKTTSEWLLTERRRRAVSPTTFGDAMEQLLGATPSSGPAILSLAPRVRKSANASTLRAKAARIALLERRERQERAHVRDVIGEWGPPGVLPGNVPDEAVEQSFLEQGGTKGYERRLRKVAQRGGASLLTVVKLFNAIRAAQSTSTDDIDKARTLSGGRHGAKKANVVGSRETARAYLLTVNELSKSNFLDLLRGKK